MIGRIRGRRGEPRRQGASTDPAARAFLHLAPDSAVAEDSGPSVARRAAGLFLALMILAAGVRPAALSSIESRG
jgi:hypothetical protein